MNEPKFESEIDIWKDTTERPGYLGSRRPAKEAEWNEKYGAGNWRLSWQNSKGEQMNIDQIFEHYVLGYEKYFLERPDHLGYFVENAAYIYDINPNITKDNAFDFYFGYNRPGLPNEFHHVAINIAIEKRLGIKFRGKEPLQVRCKNTDKDLPIENWSLTSLLQPGFVKCVKPELILPPNEEIWWIKSDSIEGLYQYNKILQIHK